MSILEASGVERVYGLPGDSLNGFTEAMRRDGSIAWRLVRHEESAAFAAAADAELTGDLTVGQRVLIGEQAWTLTAVGAVASKNLADLGHVTMVFDGADTPRLPGAIHLAGVEETPALGHGVRLVFGDE